MIRSLASITKNLYSLTTVQYMNVNQQQQHQQPKQLKQINLINHVINNSSRITNTQFTTLLKSYQGLLPLNMPLTRTRTHINNNKSIYNFSTQKQKQTQPQTQSSQQLQPPQLSLPQLKQKIQQQSEQLTKYEKQSKTNTTEYVNLLYDHVIQLATYLIQIPVDFAMRKKMDDGFFTLQQSMRQNRKVFYKENGQLSQKINPQIVLMRFLRGSVNYQLSRFEQSITQFQNFIQNQLKQMQKHPQINTVQFRTYTQMIMAASQLVDYKSGKNKDKVLEWHRKLYEIIMNNQNIAEVTPAMRYIVLSDLIGVEFQNEKGDHISAGNIYEYIVDRVNFRNQDQLYSILKPVEILAKADKLNTEKYLPIVQKLLKNVSNDPKNLSKNQKSLIAALILQTACFHEKHYQKRYELINKLTPLFKSQSQSQSQLTDLPPYLHTLFLLRKCSLILQLNNTDKNKNKKEQVEQLIRQCLKHAKKIQNIPSSQLWKYFYKSLYEIADYARVEKFDEKFTNKVKKLDKQIRNCDARLRGKAEKQQQQKQQQQTR